ncbi:MAG: AI-2E family transporter [Deltaproteobacteria bacterium]|nr:AI-2E family transporter [Deltaproteobacteria bacterium]
MKHQTIILTGLLLVAGYLLYTVFAPFFIPLFWAAVFAIVLYPYYIWILGRTRLGRNLSAFIACVTIGVFIVVPMALLGSQIAKEVFGIYQWAQEYVKTVSAQAHQTPVFLPPYIAAFIRRYVDVSNAELNSIFTASIQEVASWLVGGMTGFVKSFAQMVFNAALAFFAMFYIFRDGWRLLAVGMRIVPLSAHDKERFLERISRVIQATVIGGLFVGAVQGLLGGLAFWAAGLGAPVLWGFAMFLLSFLPGIGTAMVWVPGSVYLFIIGDYLGGTALMLWGIFVVGLVDNFLRPLIISEAANLHPLLVFFSIIGAVDAFGLIGVIAGPLILSIAGAAVEIYEEAYHT